MKATALLAALLGLVLAGCSLSANPAKSAAPPAAPKPVTPAAPAAPPPPLSTPQTRVQLPKPQPVDPAALAVEVLLPEPPPAPAPAPTRSRRGSAAANPAAGQAASPPPAAAAAPEPRETVQEIVPPAELKRLQERTLARRREATRILNLIGRRKLTASQQSVAATIRNFLALSEEAEKRNDQRQADALAERAQILAKELQSGQ